MLDIAKTDTNIPIVCLEDDIDMNVNFTGHIQVGIRSMPADWDILLCDYCDIGYHFDSKGHFPFKVKKFACLNCFVVRNASIDQLIAENLNVKNTSLPVDHYIYVSIS